MVEFWLVGQFTTHFRTDFSAWIESDVTTGGPPIWLLTRGSGSRLDPEPRGGLHIPVQHHPARVLAEDRGVDATHVGAVAVA